MRGVIAISIGLVAVAAMASLWLHFALPFAWASVATVGLVGLCLVWLALVLTLPWNLHFQAKAVLFEMQRGRERGLPVKADREAEVHRVARRMQRLSVALHLGSAALAAGVTAAWHVAAPWGYAFSAFYLLSGAFRPGVEYYRYLRQRLGHLASEVRYPPDDVKALKAEVARLRELADATKEALAKLQKRVGEVTGEAETRDRDLEMRFTALARRFEETIDRLTDNQQILGGIKAFLRLVQEPKGV